MERRRSSTEKKRSSENRRKSLKETHRSSSSSILLGDGPPRIHLILISKGTDVLCEYSEVSFSSTTFTRTLLGKIPTDKDAELVDMHENNGKKFYFHVRVSRSIIYFAMSDATVKAARAQKFLKDVESNFVVTFGHDRISKAIAYACDSFTPRLKELLTDFNVRGMRKYSTETEAVAEQVEGVKETLMQNLDLAMVRTQELDVLIKKAEKLEGNALAFEKDSKKLKCAMMMLNLKYTIILIVVILIAVFGFTVYFCGWTFKECTKRL